MVDFIKYRVFSFSFFALVFATFCGLYYYRGGFKYSVDFTGGTQVIVRFSKPVGVGQVRDILKSTSWQNVEVSEFDKSDMRIRIPEVSVEAVGLGQKIKESLEAALPGVEVAVLQSEQVSASIGHTLIWNALWAILLALVAILGYIFIRFKFSFAVGAVVALIHDALVILTIFLLLNWEVSLDVIAALLMILGYSNNDTIVIFSRIRERMKQHSADGSSMVAIANEAIFSTLSRTLLTSFATALVVLSILIFGGETLRNLSFTLLIGIIFGTYSSIFIASPIMLLFYKEKGQKEGRESTIAQNQSI
jgi:preprotein translocase subunit SecF